MTDEKNTVRLTTTLAIAGVTNANGHRYTPEVLNQIAEHFKTDNQPVLVYAGSEDSIQNAAMLCKRLELKDDALVGTFQTLTNPTGTHLGEIMNAYGSSHLRFGMCGVGRVEDDGRITEFHLRSIGILPNDP